MQRCGGISRYASQRRSAAAGRERQAVGDCRAGRVASALKHELERVGSAAQGGGERQTKRNGEPGAAGAGHRRDARDQDQRRRCEWHEDRLAGSCRFPYSVAPRLIPRLFQRTESVCRPPEGAIFFECERQRTPACGILRLFFDSGPPARPLTMKRKSRHSAHLLATLPVLAILTGLASCGTPPPDEETTEV